ncbi:DUF5325 family protein [Ornithinibacillus gellani]|uniref:DUF5325 family protein n=1 Tax=Ornithinibacillus gellani TaxID=2293253 RepID=UPI0016810726|nr:DUF5325 family protein [Ornithinibacillus gellani]
MKNINFPMLFLAILVIAMFVAVGIAISYQNIWLIILFIVLGFGFMGYGISLKKKK